MNEERIEQIKENLRRLMEQITAMGEEPPPEIQDLLMQVIQKSQQQIQQLRQEEQVGNVAPENEGDVGIIIHPDVQMLWTLSGAQQQAFLSYLREYPSKATQALLANPTQLSAVITQLERSNPKPYERPKLG